MIRRCAELATANVRDITAESVRAAVPKQTSAVNTIAHNRRRLEHRDPGR